MPRDCGRFSERHLCTAECSGRGPLSALFRVGIDLADVDRSYYETIDVSAARHPSETAERLIARLLALALWHHPELRFGHGLSAGDQPEAAWVDASGRDRLWLMVGQPEPKRVRDFSRRSERLGLLAFGHEWPRWWARHGDELGALDKLSLLALDAGVVQALAARLSRRFKFSLTITGSRVYLAQGDWQADAELVQLAGERCADSVL